MIWECVCGVENSGKRDVCSVCGRNRDRTHASSSLSGHHYRGVGGWLYLLCITLMIFTPLGTIISFINLSRDYSRHFESTMPEIALFIIGLDMIYTFLVLCLAPFSVRAGIALWRQKDGAVRSAKHYLIMYSVYIIFAAALPFFGFSSSQLDAILAHFALKWFAGALFVLVWYSYLVFSKRVRATYDQ
jgi:hypothetical protein